VSAQRDVGRRGTSLARPLVALVVAVALLPGRAGAWTYPEHRDIMAEALKGLPLDQQQFFVALWAQAQAGHPGGGCTAMVDGDGRSAPACIDLAAWPAIAGDHSCSPDQMVAKVLPSEWIVRVAKVGAATKTGLERARIGTRSSTNGRSPTSSSNSWTLTTPRVQLPTMGISSSPVHRTIPPSI
jgi:hypothetical protein